MDRNWQPALPEDDGVPASSSIPTAVPVKATGIRRILATAALTVGLLAVGGVSVVMAASPAPSSSSAPSTTQSTPNGGAPAHRGSCPHMDGNGSGPGSGSGAGSDSDSGSVSGSDSSSPSASD